jgi:hypothetical protein
MSSLYNACCENIHRSVTCILIKARTERQGFRIMKERLKVNFLKEERRRHLHYARAIRFLNAIVSIAPSTKSYKRGRNFCLDVNLD